jgi:uncharacterized RDD family membrane protein YckC
MTNDIQKAGLWKRIAAGILDGILLSILAVGVAFLLGEFFGYDGYNTTLNESYAYYESEYGIRFQITGEEYEALSPQDKEIYDKAYDALIQDETAMKAYNMVLNLSLLITTGGILAACLILEFGVPMAFGNGQTVGKKVFGLGVVRVDGVRTTPLQMFVRTVLGKFTVEIMIPVYVVLMIFFNVTGLGGTLLLGALLVAQILIMALSRNNSLIHDLLAGTVVVDVASQMIFRNTQDLIDYKKKLSRDQSDRQIY